MVTWFLLKEQKMKRILLSCLMLGVTSFSFAQDYEVKKRLQDFFFGLSFYSDIASLKKELKDNREFNLFEDPNRDERKSIVGSIVKDKNLNSKSIRNQLVILFSSGNGKRKKVSFKWSIDYKLDDLPTALVDCEKIKSIFKPYFTDIIEKEGVGYHQEQIQTSILKLDTIEVIIRVMKYNNYSHTISIEYNDTWKIK